MTDEDLAERLAADHLSVFPSDALNVLCALKDVGYAYIPRPRLEALEAALEAARLLEAAELFHANCEECDGEIEMELCGTCFPYADAARLKRREAMDKARSAEYPD